MKKPDFKLVLSGLLILPLLLLTIYTFRSGASDKKGKIKISSLKLSSPQDLPDEIASYLEEGDYETALIRIEEDLRDPDIPTSKGVPLIVMATEKDNYEIAALIASLGADVNMRDERTNETAIIKAARNNNANMIRMLLSAGADINAQSRRGVSALSESINNKNKDIMEFLTANGARTGATFDNLMRYAYEKNNVGVSAMLRIGVDPKQKDANGNTALMVATSRGDMQSFKDLVAYGSDINAQNKQGMTPLLYALRANNRDMVKEIVSIENTDVNICNVLGQCPLYWAAYMGDDIVVNALLTLGADYNKKTTNNQTALDIARLNNRTEVVKVIEDFIKYKNMPRDKSGKVIIDKNAITQDLRKKMDEDMAKKQAGAAAQAAKAGMPSGNMKSVANPQTSQQSTAISAAAGALPQGFDMDSITKMMQQQGVNPAAVQAMQQAQNASAGVSEQASQSGDSSTRSKFKPKRINQKRVIKTKINKLETHSL